MPDWLLIQTTLSPWCTTRLFTQVVLKRAHNVAEIKQKVRGRRESVAAAAKGITPAPKPHRRRGLPLPLPFQGLSAFSAACHTNAFSANPRRRPLLQAEAKIVEFANRGYRALGIGYAEGVAALLAAGASIPTCTHAASGALQHSRVVKHSWGAPTLRARALLSCPTHHHSPQARAAPTPPEQSGSSAASFRYLIRRATTPPRRSRGERRRDTLRGASVALCRALISLRSCQSQAGCCTFGACAPS